MAEFFEVDPEALKRLSPQQREKVTRDLANLERVYRQNPLFRFHPHEKQQRFMEPDWPRKTEKGLAYSGEPFWPRLRCFFGGNRSGKTTAAIVDTIVQCVDLDVVPEHLRPYKQWDPVDMPVRVRVVTPDLTSTMEGVIHEKIREWCPAGQLKGNSFDRAFDKVQRVLRFKNGSWIQFLSSEQDREKHGGVALHRVVYDEEPRQEIRSECLTRLIDFDGEEIFAMTPFSGMKWLFDEIYEPWERGELDPRDGRVLVVDMDDNPHLSEEGKKRALASYSAEEREARKSGRFVSFSGLIYPEFSQHVVPQLQEVPRGAECFLAIDPGLRKCAVMFMCIDAEDLVTVFDEVFLEDSTVAEVCQEVHRRRLRWGHDLKDGTRAPLAYRWAVIDPAARNRSGQTGRSDQMEFQDNGISTVPGQNAVDAGINRVKERLAARKLVIAANCQRVIWEARRYRYIPATGRGEHERVAPVKKDDHCLDALRYGVMQRPLRAPRLVSLESSTVKDRILRQHLKKVRAPRRRKANSGFGPGQWS